MRMHEVRRIGKAMVDGYGPGYFRVAGKVTSGPVVIHNQEAMPWEGFEDIATITSIGDDVDILLIGTGAETAPVPEGLRTALERVGIRMEIMASPSACRTFNVLASEGRRVAAALIPLPGDS